ncbi:DUF732 domain-containing protein [Nocardia albiluteola]|uniref:DUF732 domain-containing protein n=1 Tax=Nocardia albiluteola TaxID=2842303 RepID=UPI001FDA475D|nr:DUF732 domain-containing protein [Nocardia albiluteola]
MLRTRGKATDIIAGRGAAAGAALAIASVLLLGACGNNDSTASSTPTLQTSTTTSAASSSPTPSPAAPTTSAAPAPKTTVREQPQPAQTTPTPSTPKPTAKDQAFLDALKAKGVNPSSSDIPLAVAQYVCQAKKSGVSAQEIQTYVNAMAGQDPSYDPNKMSIAQLGQIYTDAANQTYCDK